jgi:hypothetical protein
VSLNGRVLQCAGCDAFVRVMEAVMGARTEQEHEYLNADDFLCGGCLELADRVAQTRSQEAAA